MPGGESEVLDAELDRLLSALAPQPAGQPAPPQQAAPPQQPAPPQPMPQAAPPQQPQPPASLATQHQPYAAAPAAKPAALAQDLVLGMDAVQVEESFVDEHGQVAPLMPPGVIHDEPAAARAPSAAATDSPRPPGLPAVPAAPAGMRAVPCLLDLHATGAVTGRALGVFLFF